MIRKPGFADRETFERTENETLRESIRDKRQEDQKSGKLRTTPPVGTLIPPKSDDELEGLRE